MEESPSSVPDSQRSLTPVLLPNQPIRNPGPAKRKQARESNEEMIILKEIANTMAIRNKAIQDISKNPKKCSDECASFGTFIADALRSMEPRNRMMAQKKISDVIWNAKEMQLHDEVYFQGHPPQTYEETDHGRSLSYVISEGLNSLNN